MDGVEFVRELRKRDSRIKCIMISQVSEKELIGKAYTAGIDFFISKPINLIEVRSVLRNVEQQIKNERTLNNIRRMFENEMPTVTEHTRTRVTLTAGRYAMCSTGSASRGRRGRRTSCVSASICTTTV
ncbi:MAG: response regulator [Lachnospiraceae bacterium]|nr:response regulator [Lachnospiraceae bacterium]